MVKEVIRAQIIKVLEYLEEIWISFCRLCSFNWGTYSCEGTAIWDMKVYRINMTHLLGASLFRRFGEEITIFI